MKIEDEIIDNAFKKFFENVNSYPEMRDRMLELLKSGIEFMRNRLFNFNFSQSTNELLT